MCRFITPIMLLCFLCAFAIIGVLFIGDQQGSSGWLALLRLNACELPCWIGITVGKTNMKDADKLIHRTYANNSEYLLESQSDFQYLVTYNPTNYHIGIVLQADNHPSNQTSIVQRIYLLPKNPSDRPPTISDLYNVLGNPEGVRLSSGVDTPMLVVFYRNRRVLVSLKDLECHKVLLGQEITQIVIYNQTPSFRYAWLSEPQQWQGFGKCYNLTPLQ